MIIREYDHEDILQLEDIHEKHYKGEFELSELDDKNFIDKFVVTDEKDQIITFGGVRLLLEVVSLTDLDRSARDRIMALNHLLDAVSYVTKRRQFNQLHCTTINNDVWHGHLIKAGFKETKGKVLYLDLE